MSHQKTTVTQQKEHKFDILAVSRLIKGTIYREKLKSKIPILGGP